MLNYLYLTVAIVLLQVEISVEFSEQLKIDPKLPETTFRNFTDYLQGRTRDGPFLSDVGNKIGVFAVTKLGADYAQAVESFQSKAPECLKNFDQRLPVKPMADGSLRRTFATEDKTYPGCVAQEMKKISSMYDHVEKLVTQLIEKLSGRQNITYQDRGKEFLLSSSPIKDHIHVYTKTALKGESNYLVPFHIDNGIFLILTPFLSPSLHVKLSDGQIISTSGLPSDSVLILMGRGLTDWLFISENTRFYPVAHAVPPLTTTQDRVVFARMKVVPLDAVRDGSKTKFSSIFFQESDIKKSSSEDLCVGGIGDNSTLNLGAKTLLKANKELCENNTAYCWMACLALPPGCDVAGSECYNIDQIPCNGDSHDATCSWHCKKSQPSDDFCQGGMDMLMDGFDTSGGKNGTKVCVILFFKSWRLNTPGKFVAACFGVFFLGMAIEVVIALRRKVVSRKRLFLNLPIYARKLIVIALFGINLTLGYLAMLVAMTYSVELFICVVVGLVVGHGIFNSHMPVGEAIDPCCASQNPNGSFGERSPITRTPCEHDDDYQEMARNGRANHDVEGADGDGNSNCHCDDATSNTNIRL